MAKQALMPFWQFCGVVLGLDLTPGQMVIAKVAFGDSNPEDLEGEEYTLALEMFGGLKKVSPRARKFIVMRLGRGSGKTTLCSAFGIYTSVTFDCRRAGPGDIPRFITMAPDKETAKISVDMCREMIRRVPSLDRLVVNDDKESVTLRRPDGRMVKIECFAAGARGKNVRGRSIMGFIFDEAEFFTSAGGDKDYAVNDKDIFRALKPRMMKGSKGMLISTPWPVETLMGTMFDENWQKCLTAVCIKAPTLLVRGNDPEIVEMVEQELAEDPENARRELFCEAERITGDNFFDVFALNQSLEETPENAQLYNPKWPVAIGCDLGFTRDSSAIAVVQFDGKYYRTVFLEEMRPSPGKPLKPREVIRRFAAVCKQFGAAGVVSDTYYREALKEQLSEESLVVYPAPEGTNGKADVFQRTRAVLHEGNVKLHWNRDNPIMKRMVTQAKLVTSKAAPGGTVVVRIPRKIGLGHGDLVSAWVLAVHRLAYAGVKDDVVTYYPGEEGWFQESQRRLVEHQAKQQADYLKKLEKEVRKTCDKRRLRELGLR